MNAVSKTTAGAAVVAALAAVLAGCSTGQTTSGSGDGNGGAAPTVAETLGAAQNGVPAAILAAGGTTLLTTAKPEGVEAQYGPVCKGSDLGIGKIDFTKDTIGWAQSEKEANPFRIASTKSQVDTAKAKGWKLLTTNAQSNVQQENTDIKGMIDKGAKAIIFSPINSTGLGDAISYAKSKKVAMIPVDRNITGVTGCQDVGPQLGSDFVQQGRRAADAMIKATGGTAKLAILLGASGVNVTDDRTAGFLDELQQKNATGIEVVFKQTADFTREKGQSVTETLLRAHPEVNAIYAENDEMGPRRPRRPAGRRQGGHRQGPHRLDRRHQGRGPGHRRRQLRRRHRVQPAFGPAAQEALDAYVNGDGAPAVTITTDNQYDKSNAAQAIASGAAY